MSLYVLDTDMVTLFEKKRPVVVAQVQAHDPHELARLGIACIFAANVSCPRIPAVSRA